MSDTQVIAIVLGIVLVVAILKNRSVAGKLGQMSLTLDAVHDATNNRPHGSPTISQEVSSLAKGVTTLARSFSEHRSEVNSALTDIRRQLAAVTGRVDVLEQPDPDPSPQEDAA